MRRSGEIGTFPTKRKDKKMQVELTIKSLVSESDFVSKKGKECHIQNYVATDLQGKFYTLRVFCPKGSLPYTEGKRKIDISSLKRGYNGISEIVSFGS